MIPDYQLRNRKPPRKNHDALLARPPSQSARQLEHRFLIALLLNIENNELLQRHRSKVFLNTV
jgi:hypothetical protein